jgi:hypothetical protein
MESAIRVAGLLTVVVLGMMAAGAISSMENKLARNSALFACIVSGVVAVWFFIVQSELRSRRMSLRSLICLLIAISVGTKLSLLVIASAD